MLFFMCSNCGTINTAVEKTEAIQARRRFILVGAIATVALIALVGLYTIMKLGGSNATK
jgi:hypothetical protein